MTHVYSKVMKLSDYLNLKVPIGILNLFEKKLMTEGIPSLKQHSHRMWEYATVLKAMHDLFNSDGVKVLDVGGAGALLSATLAHLGHDVTQIDPSEDGRLMVAAQNCCVNNPITYIKQDFLTASDSKYDAVLCISVIEHVHNDLDFVRKLAENVDRGGLLVITTDFSPSGEALSSWHLRTYNEQSLLALGSMLIDMGFTYLNNNPSYKNFSADVYDWTFASLIMIKE